MPWFDKLTTRVVHVGRINLKRKSTKWNVTREAPTQ